MKTESALERVILPVILLLGSMALLLPCADGGSAPAHIRAGITNFYSYEYFVRYFQNIEERGDIVTEEGYAEFVAYAEGFYEQRLDQRDLNALAEFFNSRGAKVFRDLIIEGHKNDPVWEFYRMKIDAPVGNHTDDSLFVPEVEVDSANDEEADAWICSLHPQNHAHEKGACGICGMELKRAE